MFRSPDTDIPANAYNAAQVQPETERMQAGQQQAGQPAVKLGIKKILEVMLYKFRRDFPGVTPRYIYLPPGLHGDVEDAAEETFVSAGFPASLFASADWRFMGCHVLPHSEEDLVITSQPL